MKKVLFIDRDGTLILEPEDEQIDSIEKLKFYPGAISALREIVKTTDYELVMVSNQDGLGTESFPTADFQALHDLIIRTFEGEGVAFKEVLIDPSFPEDKSEFRKPNTGLVRHYQNEAYDLENSWVIGDRISDLEFAKNLGTKAIFLSSESNPLATENTNSWKEVVGILKGVHRKVNLERKTRESDISLCLNLNGNQVSKIDTGLGFLNHMLEQWVYHGNIDLELKVEGDLEVDEHHVMEDVALVLGQGFKKALGNKKGINRYGFLLPMDEAQAQIALDFGGRPQLVWDAEFRREKIGDCPTEMFKHFFKSFSDAALANVQIKCRGENEHHKIESIFKGFAKCLRQAIETSNQIETPSSKGAL